MSTTSLAGTWELLPVQEFKDRYDDEEWLEMEIPSHWQQHPDLGSYAGKMIYRKVFLFRKRRGKRYRLRLDGIFYRSSVYLNGRALGEHEGYFFPQEYEVTGFLKRENTLLVEVDCPDEEDKEAKALLTGVFSHWDALDPQSNPGGIWLPVKIVESGEVYIKGTGFRVLSVTDDSAQVEGSVSLDAATPGLAEVRMTFKPHNFEGAAQSFDQQVQLERGANELSMTLSIEEPRLWWTHDQGNPHQCGGTRQGAT